MLESRVRLKLQAEKTPQNSQESKSDGVSFLMKLQADKIHKSHTRNVFESRFNKVAG